MKNMKAIYIINKILFIINILLYEMVITFFLALMFQVLLGAVQILIFLFLLYQFKKFGPTDQKLIITYGILVIFYAIAFLLQNEYNEFFVNDIHFINDIHIGTFIMVIPMLLASFHLYITYRLRNYEL